ncbi:hypothetical protein Tdes44962_MAKER00495 [Teratosphaeria destructans]|uniref:F-box domain-containing protein n=1 Tax=Teratosphaeria destructans TaxID=418781 RepID=A0A9W7SPT7_9PEZI|nr:hypothetical protein Tdes44962_MAKER00495 [Teratosphaeria destructans]
MSISAINLPAEIWLEIIPHIPYTPTQLTHLRLTNRTLNNLLRTHEHSLVAAIRHTQLCSPTLNLHLFPSLIPKTYADLHTLHRRSDTLASLHEKWLHIVSSSEEFHWLDGRWTSIHKAGLLLLYRLQDTPSQACKLRLLASLPSTSLACLLFKLISSVKILRVFGPDPIHLRHALGDAPTRADIELACEELLLQHGPEFFVRLLEHDDAAGALLRKEFEGMEERQVAGEGVTLIAGLRRALADVSGCGVREVVCRMWAILSCTGFDGVDEAGLGMIVRGEVVRCGMRRVGF